MNWGTLSSTLFIRGSVKYESITSTKNTGVDKVVDLRYNGSQKGSRLGSAFLPKIDSLF